MAKTKTKPAADVPAVGEVPMQTILTPFDALAAEASDAIAASESVQVVDEYSAESAADLARGLYEIEKALEARRVQAVKPYNDEVKRINSYVKEAAAKVGAAKDRFQQAIASWQAAERRRIAEENARRAAEAEAERRRIEAENAARIAAAEAETARAIAAAEAEAELLGAPLEEVLPALPDLQLEVAPPEPVILAAPSKLVRTRTEVEVTITDIKQIPRDILEELAGRYEDQLKTIIKRARSNGRQVPGAAFREYEAPISQGYK